MKQDNSNKTPKQLLEAYYGRTSEEQLNAANAQAFWSKEAVDLMSFIRNVEDDMLNHVKNLPANLRLEEGLKVYRQLLDNDKEYVDTCKRFSLLMMSIKESSARVDRLTKQTAALKAIIEKHEPDDKYREAVLPDFLDE